MKKFNIIIVYNNDNSKILMCKRKKEPFKDKLNLVGGKVEDNEDDIKAAYRELSEETGIKEENINLKHLMNFDYLFQDMQLQVYIGKVKKQIKLVEEINELFWIEVNSDFWNLDKFAGDGNIWHMIKYADNYKNEL